MFYNKQQNRKTNLSFSKSFEAFEFELELWLFKREVGLDYSVLISVDSVTV